MGFTTSHLLRIYWRVFSTVLMIGPGPWIVQAQQHQPRFEHFGTAQRLSQNSAFCLFQDAQGFLWIGTQNGLNRYDGYSFKSYYHDPLDSTSISDSYIVNITEDKQHRLWISTLAGTVDVLMRESGKFTRLMIDHEKVGRLKAQRAVLLLRDRSGGLWMTFDNGRLLYLPPDSMHLTPQTLLNSAMENVVQAADDEPLSVFEDSRGDIWVGTMNGIILLPRDRDGGRVLTAGKRTWTLGTPIFCFGELSGMPGLLWVGTNDGLRLFDTRRSAFVSWESLVAPNAVLREEAVRSIAEVSPGVLWVGTNNEGLFEIDVTSRRVTHYKHNPTEPQGLSDNRVTAIMQDRSGVVWLGSLTGGISKTLRDTYPFRYVGYDPQDREGLRDYDVTAMRVDRDETLWVGTRKGGLHRSREGAATSVMRFHRYPIGRTNRREIPDPYVKAIHEDRRGNLWVGLWADPGGLLLANPNRESFTSFTHDPAEPLSIASDLVRAIRDDDDGYLWIGTTRGGLSRIHLDSLTARKFQNYLPDETDPNSLSMNDVFSIALSTHPGSTELWLGTYKKGLNRLNTATGMFTRFQFVPGDTTCICDDRVSTVFEDQMGNIWIGTHRGLALLKAEHRSTGKFECFGEREGLAHPLVLGVMEDDHGNLWVSTQTGLSRFTPATGTFANFYSGTHLPIKEFNLNSFCKDGEGRMYFGGVNGFIHFHPDSIRINREPPAVVITSFKVFEKEMELDSAITEKRAVSLSYDDDFLSFEFAALDFREPSRNLYAYKMEGVNADWVQIGNRRYVSFSNLVPGEYLFRVKASNNDGVWNEQGTNLSIVIMPPFWMTAWFRIVAAGLFLAVVILVVRYLSTVGLRRRLRDLEVRQKVQQERERISSELHDDIGANLTNLATGLEVSQKYVPDDESGDLKENLIFLEGAARSTIRSLRETIWSLQPESGSVASLAQRIDDYLDERTRLITVPRVRRSLDGDGALMLSPTQALNVYRICQEAVNNALKHASAGEISVELEVNGNNLLLRVRDDGKGFDPATRTSQQGYGLENMKRRAARINATLEQRSAPGSGTLIQVTLHE